MGCLALAGLPAPPTQERPPWATRFGNLDVAVANPVDDVPDLDIEVANPDNEVRSPEVGVAALGDKIRNPVGGVPNLDVEAWNPGDEVESLKSERTEPRGQDSEPWR